MIQVHVQGIEPLVNRMRKFPQQWPRIIDVNFGTLGRRIAYLMRQTLKPVRFTGATEESVVSEVDVPNMRVTIGPTTPQALFIRTGTRPHWAPIAPIRAWAAAKLGEEKVAWAIRGGIAHHGTSVWIERQGLGDGHGGFDYPGKTLQRGDTQAALVATAQRLGEDIAAFVGEEL